MACGAVACFFVVTMLRKKRLRMLDRNGCRKESGDRKAAAGCVRWMRLNETVDATADMDSFLQINMAAFLKPNYGSKQPKMQNFSTASRHHAAEMLCFGIVIHACLLHAWHVRHVRCSA
ncbi:MAG: hypothetical protein KA972_04810 [Brachymonas sp.]|nr:hypothetical protein [Brachymonas sp.]